LDIGETLIPGDYPIALYRKRRKVLAKIAKNIPSNL
jgi:hypothetical protein